MPLITLRQLLDHAAENDYGVPAFNVNNLEQIRAVMEAAEATNSPVIVQASAGAREYAGPLFIYHLIRGGDSGMAADSDLYASGSRRFSRDLSAFHPVGVFFRDDGWFFARRYENSQRLRI